MADFGLVKELAVDADAQLTGVSTLLGTPQYMAPESILESGAADARSDIYALGAVAYYLLAGVDVFDGNSVLQLCIQHLHQAPESLVARGVAVTAELDALVLACLDKQPDRRPQTTAELRRRLESCIVAPWTAENAHAWWSQHQSEMERGEAPSAGTGRTIEVAANARYTREQAPSSPALVV